MSLRFISSQMLLRQTAYSLFFHGSRVGEPKPWIEHALGPLRMRPMDLRIAWAGALVETALAAWHHHVLSEGRVLSTLALGVDTLPEPLMRTAALRLFCEGVGASDWTSLVRSQLMHELHHGAALPVASHAFLYRMLPTQRDVLEGRQDICQSLQKALGDYAAEADVDGSGLRLPVSDYANPESLAGWVFTVLDPLCTRFVLEGLGRDAERQEGEVPTLRFS